MLGVRAATYAPVTTLTTTITVANAEVVQMVIVNPWMGADGTSRPALVGKSQTSAPAAATGGKLILQHRGAGTLNLFLARGGTGRARE